MRLKSVSIQNFRLIAASTIEVPSGLTLVNGENGLGKSSIFQAILWCLYGPNAIGDNQTSLVRQGHRNMEVKVALQKGDLTYTAVRKFSLSPDGKSGRTELSFGVFIGQAFDDMSGGTVAEAQTAIERAIGPREIFMATAYVDQHDGPGAFLRSTPAEQRHQLRDLLNISDSWDVWFDLAKAKHKHVTGKLAEAETRIVAGNEFIEENSGAPTDVKQYGMDRDAYATRVDELQTERNILQGQQDDADEVAEANKALADAIAKNRTALDAAVDVHRDAYDERDRLEALIQNLPTLRTGYERWQEESEAWDKDNILYQEEVRDYASALEEWSHKEAFLRGLLDYYVDTERAREIHTFAIEEIDAHLEESPPTTHCPTCAQELKSDDAFTRANASRQKMADDRTAHVTILNELNESVDDNEIRETGMAHDESKPEQPEPMYDRPVFKYQAQYDEAKNASIALTSHNETIKMVEADVNRLEVERDSLAEPVEIDQDAYREREQQITRINNDLRTVEVNRDGAARQLAQAEKVVEQIEQSKERLQILKGEKTAYEAQLADLDIVVTGTGPNGARQLMIDQLLGDFQSEVNDWLNVLLPGFSIYMDTQAESGRETFETAFTTPTGVVGWHGLSGAQRVAVGLSTRLALARMYDQRAGHRYETWIIDEADGAMRGEKREAFVAMLYKLQERGIDLLVVSHADTVVERMEQRIEVVDAGGYTEVK